MSHRSTFTILVALAAAACSDDAPAVGDAAPRPDARPPECSGFIGTPGALPVMETVQFVKTGETPPQYPGDMSGYTGMMADLPDGADLPIIFAPQGQFIVFPAARAMNVPECVVLGAVMVDPCTGFEVAREQRSVRLEPRDDGWAIPADSTLIGNYANLQACPKQSSRDIHAQPYELEIALSTRPTDDTPSELLVAKTITVTPRCAPDDVNGCLCTCDADFILGQPCNMDPIDAGVIGCGGDVADAGAP